MYPGGGSQQGVRISERAMGSAARAARRGAAARRRLPPPVPHGGRRLAAGAAPAPRPQRRQPAPRQPRHILQVSLHYTTLHYTAVSVVANGYSEHEPFHGSQSLRDFEPVDQLTAVDDVRFLDHNQRPGLASVRHCDCPS